MEYDVDEQTLPTVNGQGAAALALMSRLAVEDAPFGATGVAKVKVTKQGQVRTLAIPIKSIALEDVEKVVAPLRPKVPTYRDNIKGKWVTVTNEADDAYQQRLVAYQKALSHAWVLMALDLDVVDGTGQVVWSRDNTVQHLDAAVKALKDMGLVDGQLVAIFRAVQELTQDVQEQTDSD